MGTAALRGDQLWALHGKNRIIVFQQGKPAEEAKVLPNNILAGGRVLRFQDTPYGLIAIGEGSVGLIEPAP